MRDALDATGRPVLFSICEWGLQDPARWAGEVGNSWRISYVHCLSFSISWLHKLTDLSCINRNDIGPPPSWDNIFRIINEVVPVTGFAGPGGFNDLDLLEVGNAGLTVEEQKTHFVFCAAAK